MKLKETRILDAEGARYACIANHYCTRCDCEEYDRILTDADSSSRAASRSMIWPVSRRPSRPSAKRTMMFPPLPLLCPGAPLSTLSRCKPLP